MEMKPFKLNPELVETFLKKLQKQGNLEGLPKRVTLNQAIEWLNENWNTKIGVIGSDYITAEEHEKTRSILAEKVQELSALRTKHDTFKAMHERWKENQPAMVKIQAAEINKQSQEVTANANINVAKIKATSQMTSAAMSAAAKEDKFSEMFGDVVKDLIPNIFLDKEQPKAIETTGKGAE